MPATHIDLSQPVADGTVTTPGHPAAGLGWWRTHDDTRDLYAPGTSFSFSRLDIIGGTGTYMDAPLHRFADGADITGYAVSRLVNVPGVVIDVEGDALRADAVAGLELEGVAVLVRTGASARFNTPDYATHAPFVTSDAAAVLAQAQPAWVGIDGPNVDSTEGDERPVHTTLLAAGVPIVEHMANLERLPTFGFTVTALPLNFVGLATSPVRPVATL